MELGFALIFPHKVKSQSLLKSGDKAHTKFPPSCISKILNLIIFINDTITVFNVVILLLYSHLISYNIYS